jgi:single-strand DNA-binding protein
MPDAITLTGLVATPPRHLVTSEGLPITSFRLASSQRRFDRSQEKWIDGETNWYTVTAFRQLALNSNASIDKGQRVIVTGRLKIREWENGEKSGTTIEIEAESIGHDLSWGTASFTRSVSAATVLAPDPEAEAADSTEADAADAEQLPDAGPSASAEAPEAVDADAVPVPF